VKRDFRGLSGFTLIEVLVIVMILLVFAGFLLPSRGRRGERSTRIRCVNNLKNVALAARIFATDHNDRMPGDFFRSNSVDLASLDVMKFFGMFTNELSTPKILWCPEDKHRQEAKSFTNFTTKNISYFGSVSADEIIPLSFLAGDRNLQAGGEDLPPGLTSITTNLLLGWSKEIHHEQGNIAMGDGSVQQFSPARLNVGVREQGIATNLLVIP
jgi:type II secretory pathway pseudopilin PulG